MPLTQELLDRIARSDPTLTELNLNRTAIGDVHDIDLIDDHNHSSATTGHDVPSHRRDNGDLVQLDDARGALGHRKSRLHR